MKPMARSALVLLVTMLACAAKPASTSNEPDVTEMSEATRDRLDAQCRSGDVSACHRLERDPIVSGETTAS